MSEDQGEFPQKERISQDQASKEAAIVRQGVANRLFENANQRLAQTSPLGKNILQFLKDCYQNVFPVDYNPEKALLGKEQRLISLLRLFSSENKVRVSDPETVDKGSNISAQTVKRFKGHQAIIITGGKVRNSDQLERIFYQTRVNFSSADAKSTAQFFAQKPGGYRLAVVDPNLGRLFEARINGNQFVVDCAVAPAEVTCSCASVNNQSGDNPINQLKSLLLDPSSVRVG